MLLETSKRIKEDDTPVDVAAYSQRWSVVRSHTAQFEIAVLPEEYALIRIPVPDPFEPNSAFATYSEAAVVRVAINVGGLVVVA